jgi:hypothetical protein
MDQPETLLLDMAAWLPQELMDTDEDSDDDDDDVAAADGEEQMTLLQLAHVSWFMLLNTHVGVCMAVSGCAVVLSPVQTLLVTAPGADNH